MTFIVGSDQTIYQILEKPKNSRRNLPEAFFMGGLARTHCGAYSSLLDPLDEFKLLVSSALASWPAP